MLGRLLVLIIVLMATPYTRADAINVELSSDSARLIYASEIYGSQYGPIDLEFSGFFNDDSDTMLTAGFLVRNDTLDSPLVISIGTRLYYADGGNAPGQTSVQAGALTIGGELLYFPANFKGFGFGVYFFMAPEIVTFLDADGFVEYGGRFEYEITKQSSIYMGYSKAEIDSNNNAGTVEIKSGFFVGIGMRF